MWIYQANFCVDCGMAFPQLQQRRWWPRSYFCQSCRGRLKRVFYLRYAVVLFLVISGNLGLEYFQTTEKSLIDHPSITQPVTLQNNTVTKPIALVPVWCAARTKKGKPCQRQVKQGKFCWQHQAINSIKSGDNLSKHGFDKRPRQSP
jgi:hypothetical protein